MIDDFSTLLKHAEDCDRRLDAHGIALQRLELSAIHDTAEIASLRATRHEHGTHIQRHILELQEIRQRQTETYEKRLCEAEKGVADLHAKQEKSVTEITTRQERGVQIMADKIAVHDKLIASLASDVRLGSWKIGLVIGAIVAALQFGLKFIH